MIRNCQVPIRVKVSTYQSREIQGDLRLPLATCIDFITKPSKGKDGRVNEWMLWMKTRLLISALFVFQKFDYDWKPEWSVRMSDNPLCYTLTQMTCWRIDSHSHPQEMSSVAKCGRLMQSSLWSKHQKPLNQHRVPEDARKKVGWWNNTIDIYCRSVLPLMKLLHSFCILN